MSLEKLSYGVLFDVKKRVNAFLQNSLDRKKEATELLCLSKRLVLSAILIPASSCIWCFSTQNLQEHISLSKNTHAMKCLSIDQQVNCIINKLNNLLHLDNNIPMISQIAKILCIKSIQHHLMYPTFIHTFESTHQS